MSPAKVKGPGEAELKMKQCVDQEKEERYADISPIFNYVSLNSVRFKAGFDLHDISIGCIQAIV